jgi:hypothetical protein
MNIQKCLLLPIVLCAASALSAATLLDDTFTSGTTGNFKTTGVTNVGIGTQSPSASAEWFGIGSNTTAPITYNQNIGIKSAVNSISSSQGALAYFEAPGSQVNLAVGETITESIIFQYATAPTNSGAGLKIQLLNSNSTGSQNNQALSELGTNNGGSNSANVVATNYSGFFVQLDPNASTAIAGIDTIFFRPVGANTSWVASNGGMTALNTTAVGPIASLGTDKYNAVLTLTYTNPTTETLGFNVLDLTTGGTDVAAYDISGATTTRLVTSFDTVALGFASGEPVQTISEASVVTTDIPEPSTYAAILGAATLGLVALRSRRQRRLSVSC